MNITPKSRTIRFFEKFGEGMGDEYEIIGSSLLCEAALAWPASQQHRERQMGHVYGAVYALRIGDRHVHKLLLYQNKEFSSKHVMGVKDLAIECATEALAPLLGDKTNVNVELQLQIIDVQLAESAVKLVFHGRDHRPL
ncbi:hypothetical protein TWF730_011281 [Orbilia blumenaviensis]|uniref:Uncharacterized protein n=1 Tax=Orbilia blumenaviensis TaxID=1796055 RepID=A0AAV9UJW0_9PEZI